MKQLFFLLFILNLNAFSGINAQQIHEYRVENADLKTCIFKVEQMTGMGFLYNGEELEKIRGINLDVTDISVDALLNKLLQGTGYTFQVVNNIIAIIKMPERANSQDLPQAKRRVRGSVTDVNNDPLPGVTVVIKGSNIGVSTDIHGEFNIDLPDIRELVLIFTYIGMKKVEVAVKDDKPLNVVLEEDRQDLEEVVVNGLFTQNRNSYTGSVTSIRSEDILAVSSTNLVKALSILTPGLRIVENNEMGSNPNHIPEIIIRGTASIASQGEYGLNTPLIVMDGVEISMERLYDLDIFEIDRIDVLKDASATAIYGEQAANGVIVIERKKVADRKIRLRYSFVPSFEFPDTESYNYCNAEQKLELERLAGLYDSPTGNQDQLYNEKFKRIQRGVNTDWIAKPLRNSASFSHSLSMTGRGGGMDYSVTARFSDKRGVMKKDYRSNYGLAFYFSYRLANVLTITYRADISKTDSQDSPYGTFSEFVKINPYDTPYNEYGEWNKILSYNFRNPLYDATTESFSKSKGKTITNSINLRWDIMKGFYLTASFNHSLSDSRSDNFVSPDHSSFENEVDPGKRGRYSVSGSEGNSWQLRGGVTFNKALDEMGSLITVNVGANAGRNNSNSYNFSGIGFLKASLTDLAFANSYPTSGRPGGSEALNSSVGLYANLNIIFLNRYFMDGSFRTSGSSKFGKDRRFAPFWSVGIGWNAHNEAFLKQTELFDIFRIRASVGYTGSINFSDYQAVTTYKYNQSNNYYIGMGALPITMGNDRLKWQTTIKYNSGFTLEMFQNRLSVNFDIYNEVTKDLLLSVSTPPSVGVNFVTDNLGETGNWGYEWSVSGLIIKRPGLYWRLGISGQHTENKLKKISNSMKRQNDEAMQELGVAAPKLQLEEGESSTAIYAVPSLGIDPASGREVFIKKDGSYTFEYDVKDKVALGNTVPYIQGALTTSLGGFKGFTVSAAVSFTFGGDIYNSTRASKIEKINPEENVDVRAFTERWKKPGDLVHYIALTNAKTYAHTQRFIEKRDEVHLSSLNISYEFKPEWVRKIGLKKLSVGVGFSDVLRLSTVKFERGTSYPYSRGYNFTISPTF